MHELSRRFLSEPNLDLMVRALLDTASHVPSVSAITFRLRNHTTGDFDPVACHNLDDDEWRNAIPSGGSLSKLVKEKKTSITLTDLQSAAFVHNASFLKKYNLIFYLGIPLIWQDSVSGVMGFYSADARGIAGTDIEFLSLIADMAAIAVGYFSQSSAGSQKPPELEALHGLNASSERVKEEFLNVMSHEFRTPLSLIMGHAGMMCEGLLGEVNEEQKNSLERIIENSDRLLAMVMSILQVSRLEAGGVQLMPRKIILRELFDELKSTYDGQQSDLRKIVWYCPPDLPVLRTDQERLKDILRQLVDNAIKFTARGRIIISAEKVDAPPSIRFAVADTGVGVSPEALSFIFERFRQSDSSVNRAFDGTGLGLYIAKKYTVLLGGELGVRSELGKGATFTLVIPLDA